MDASVKVLLALFILPVHAPVCKVAVVKGAHSLEFPIDSNPLLCALLLFEVCEKDYREVCTCGPKS